MGVVAAATGRIEVDPGELLRAGQRMGLLGTALSLLSDVLGAALDSGIASGLDPAGADFGIKYGRQAQGFAEALAKAADSFKAVGYMLEATGYNYQNADAASTIGGPGPTGGVGSEPSKTTAGTAPLGPSSATVSPPMKWSVIQPLLRLVPGIGMFASAAMTWPSGDPSLMRLTAAQWRNLATGLSAFDDDLVALQTALSQQSIPEGGRIAEALTSRARGLTELSTHASGLAQLIDDFAGGVQETQDAIRRLLDRISLDALWDTVTGFFNGEGDDNLREIANDVGDVLENFQSQVKGVVGLLEELITAIGDLATEFQAWIRPILVATFGDAVGNDLADAVTLYTDFQVGLVTGLISTVAGTVSMADPDTWKGMADMALSVAQDPSSLPGVLANMGKEFVAWDQWSGDHPGRAAGQAAFNIGSLFVPGGALSKTGTLARGLSYTTRLLDEGRLPQLSDLPGLGGGTRGLDDLPGAGPGLPEIPEFRPGAVPDSIVGPFTPNGVGTPVNPPGSGVPAGPAGPPDPPGPSGTPVGGNGHGSGPGGGGDGPPPDSPGSPVSPSDMGLGLADPPSDPVSSGAGSVDSPRVSEPPGSPTPNGAPSSDDAPSPGTQHAPESSSPAGTHTSGLPSPESGMSSTRGGDALSEGHRTGSENHGGRSDEPARTPDQHLPTHTPAAEHPTGSERPASDGSQSREQSEPRTDGAGQRQEPAGMAPGVMTGMPMAPHTAGGVHSSADSGPAGKTQTPEASTRTPDAKPPQAGSPEGPRAQTPATAGPGAGSSPSAPVDTAAGQQMSGDLSQPARPGTEPQSSSGPVSDTPAATSSDAGGAGDGLGRPEPAVGATDDPLEPPSGDLGPPAADQVPGDQGDGDGSRVYSLMDESSHRTSFAPEQLVDNQRVADALDKHGVSRSDFVDLIQRPTDSLTPDERSLINAVRDELPSPARDTVMQKVIPPGYFNTAGELVQSRADDYIMGNNPRVSVDQVGGAVTFADDTSHLSTPGQIYDGLRLDYTASPFAHHDAGTHIIRFQEDPASSGFYEVPRNSDMGGSGAYDTWDDPFTGNGFTKSGDEVVPEYVAKNITMRDGAEMWEVLEDGTQRLVAVLRDKVWVPQGN